MSKNILIEKLDQPEVLEEIYRNSPLEFESLLRDALAQNSESETLRVWSARLFYKDPLVRVQRNASIYLVVFLCLFAGFISKLPKFFNITGEWYYPRFVPLAIIMVIIIYFLRIISNTKIRKVVSSGLVISIFYLLALPNNSDSASITMALIHAPLVLLTLLAVSFMSSDWRDVESRLNFIRYVGEMVIYAALILLGGVVLSGITLGLFRLIGLSIEQWYMEYIVVLGLISSPLVATCLYDSVLSRESRFATVLSNVFSPLFLITILAYLISTIYQDKSPYSDREFLITFNGLLLVILAVTVFSISGKTKKPKTHVTDSINIALVSVTLIVDVIALSAIIFRWAEYGITVNRVVVTGANVLIFIHLSLLLRQYIKYIKYQHSVKPLETVIARYIPVYSIWSLIVAVLLPVAFQYK